MDEMIDKELGSIYGSANYDLTLGGHSEGEAAAARLGPDESVVHN